MSKEAKPYPHQQETIDNLNKEFVKGNTKQLVVLPSGSGKTHTIAFHVKQLKPKTFLYVVHRNEILYQSIKVFRQTIPWISDLAIGVINQERKDYDKPYLFATIQTLSHPKNLDKLRNKKIEYVVIDEYHHVAAPSYKKILKTIKPKYFVGLTATPYRLDKKDIFSFVDSKIANSIDLFEGISSKILVPFHYIGLHDDIDYSTIKFNGYQYHTGDLDRKLIIHKRDDAVIDEYFKKIDSDNNRLSTIVFCNSVEHVKRMTDRFNKEGVRTAGIFHQQDIEEKRNIIDQFRQGFYKVLLTRDILNEGVDFPECSALMFLRPTISKTIFLQQLGRGLRKNKGKKDVLVLDFVGNYHKAFEKRHWFLTSDSKVELKQYTGEYIKPIYEFDYPKPVIEFDNRVIEIMDIQERYYAEYGSKTTNDESKLKENYFNVKKIWLEKRNQLKKNNRRYITKRIKDTRNYLPVTVLRNSKDSLYCITPYMEKYGTYINFLRAIGELPAKEKEDLHLHGSDSKEIKIKKLLRLTKLLQKKLGRKFFTQVDWTREYGSNGLRFMKTNYGSIQRFRELMGIKNGVNSKCSHCNKPFLLKFINKRGKNSFCSAECTYKFHAGLDAKTRINRLELRKERLKLKTKCLECGKEINQYTYHDSVNGIRKRSFCDKKCIMKYYDNRKDQKKIINF